MLIISCHTLFDFREGDVGIWSMNVCVVARWNVFMMLNMWLFKTTQVKLNIIDHLALPVPVVTQVLLCLTAP